MRLHELIDDTFADGGLGQLDHGASDSPSGDLRYTDASHHVGTTRMSSRSHDGVVDEQCKVHGVANLFIAGSGVFPTSGHANPTLTIVALAVRLARASDGVAVNVTSTTQYHETNHAHQTVTYWRRYPGT